MTITFTLTGRAPELTTHFYPPLELDEKKDYSVCLISLQTFFTIPNVNEKNNKFITGTRNVIIPPGSYELSAIEDYLKNELGHNKISLEANNNTMKAELRCEWSVDFSQPGTIGPMLGFPAEVLPGKKKHISTNPVNIFDVSVIRVEVSIASGSIVDGVKSHVIHQFFPNIPPGYKIVVTPVNLLYYPLNARTIDTVSVRLVDQHGKLIDFRNEEASVTLHLKENGS